LKKQGKPSVKRTIELVSCRSQTIKDDVLRFRKENRQARRLTGKLPGGIGEPEAAEKVEEGKRQ
jgi:hypothetical protein